jgi:hypothetical protein
VLELAQASGVSTLACENALGVSTTEQYDQIYKVATTDNISYFTYMRLSPDLMEGDNWKNFERFLNMMKCT